MSQRILIIDDDEGLLSLLRDYLGQFGFTVVTAAHPEAGLGELRTEPPDLLVLDVMLPSMDGFAVCRKVRETSSLPIIMVTARGELSDRVVGLELGADDYLPKPFEPRELVARIQAVLRRGTQTPQLGRLRVGALEIDLDSQIVTVEQRAVTLTTTEFELLGVLARSPGRVFTRDRIMDTMRGIDWETYDRSIDVLISRLRHKLGDDPKSPTFIRTVWGKGYQLIGSGRA